MDKRDRMSRGRNASLMSIAINIVLVLLKGIAGVFAGSISMVADAVNNLMDAAANVVTLLGFKLASKPADAEHPYGHGRIEYLAGLGVAILILLAGVELIQESVTRILNPRPTSFTPVTLAILVLSICAKLYMATFNRKVAQAIDSGALEAASDDARYDAVATSAILVGGIVSSYTGLAMDGPLGVAVGLFVLWGGVDMLRKTVDPLLGRTPDPQLVERIRLQIMSNPNVLGAHDLMVHDYGPGRLFASAHVEMPAEESPLLTHQTIDEIERSIRDAEGVAIVLHYDPIVTSDHEHSDLHGQITRAVQAVDPALSVHDPNLDVTDNGLELSFDCVRPAQYKLTDQELRQRIVSEIHAILPDASCRITFDDGFVSPTSDAMDSNSQMSPVS